MRNSESSRHYHGTQVNPVRSQKHPTLLVVEGSIVYKAQKEKKKSKNIPDGYDDQSAKQRRLLRPVKKTSTNTTKGDKGSTKILGYIDPPKRVTEESLKTTNV